MVDRDLARAKLAHIAANLAILEKKENMEQAEFLTSTDQQYVVLHALQLAIQAAIDLAAHIVADEGWDIPERSGDTFITLGAHAVLNSELSKRLRTMASFRNLIVHEYAALDLGAVYKIWHDSVGDLRQFAMSVSTRFSLE